MAFYAFARRADDVADHPTASAAEKLARLEAMRATICGQSDVEPAARHLRETMDAHRLDPIHALDLLEAFTRDVTVNRYESWDALMDYCRWSAMPVGRFVLDVHGEDRALWPASDALCAALQVINHLQDCGKDYRALDRIYLPADLRARHGASAADLGRHRAAHAVVAVHPAVGVRGERVTAVGGGAQRQSCDRLLRGEAGVRRSRRGCRWKRGTAYRSQDRSRAT